MAKRIRLREDVELFSRGRQEVRRALTILSGLESATDDLARHLLECEDFGPEWLDRFMVTLRQCDFVVERRREWHIDSRVRASLLGELVRDKALSGRIHHRLFRIARSGDFVGEVPGYIQHEVGRAYHGVFAGAPEALSAYSVIAATPRLSGYQWLASRLISEQVALGAIAGDRIEAQFLPAMVMYREGRKREAEPLLRVVAQRPELRYEVATASHLVGRDDLEHYRSQERGEALLRRSIDVNKELGDDLHAAQALMTLGSFLARDRERHAEAEELLRESLAFSARGGGGDEWDSPVLQALGQLIGKDPARAEEGEEFLRRSLEIEAPSGNARNISQRLHLIGQLVERDPTRRQEAEEFLRHSVDLTEEDSFAKAQVLNTLGRLVGKDPARLEEAEGMLLRSLEIGERLKKKNHQAQVLYALSQLAGVEPARAEGLLTRSLEINHDIGNQSGQRIVEHALRKLWRGRESS